ARSLSVDARPLRGGGSGERHVKDVIREGASAAEIADVQRRLRSLGFEIDDDADSFGESTRQAVRAFQQQRALLVDGIVGPQTWSELVGASWRLGDRILYMRVPPMRGDDVSQLQRQMNALGFDSGKEDGIFGPNTDRAVRAFQKEYGVAEDGMFGPSSQAALGGLRIDRPGTARPLREELDRLGHPGVAGATIVLDPGHGGDDRGAADANGRNEATLCWAIAQSLARHLSRAGATVRLTRSGDEELDASERARRANELGADLFISLHLNAHQEAKAKGASTFYFGGSGAGEALAERIQERLIELGLDDCRTHARSYSLLKETRMPAVIVEPVFITNPVEAGRLDDETFVDEIARAIAIGTLGYFDKEA
ncbi:MAG TPA: N-acetylmuramoyl-L-alanine amidase, partial [Actinomycetota bacterium]|nr:N-acetylmuramoyl-L-alanine amidase [Actinomycetota bacterium]